jgi:hypothetical protein
MPMTAGEERPLGTPMTMAVEARAGWGRIPVQGETPLRSYLVPQPGERTGVRRPPAQSVAARTTPVVDFSCAEQTGFGG